MQNLKSQIKERLFNALRQKFSTYQPESAYMPFHTRLLGKDRMALYSFIQSLNTNFGTSIFEPVAEELARVRFEIDTYFAKFNIKARTDYGKNI